MQFWTRSSDTDRKKAAASALAVTEEEVQGLEGLSRELFLEIVDMRNNISREKKTRTIKGRLLNVIGYFMCIFCCYKTFMAIINTVFNREKNKDPATMVLERGLFFSQYLLPKSWVSQVNVEVWIQNFSFVLVGVLVFTQTRGFLMTIMKIFFRVSSSISSNSVVLLLAQVMGMYFMSSILLMRMNLPEKYRNSVSDHFGQIQFSFYHHWFDGIFVCSAVATVAIFYFLNKMNAKRKDDQGDGSCA